MSARARRSPGSKALMLLRSLRKMRAEDVKAHSVKGQYGSGAVNGAAAALKSQPLASPPCPLASRLFPLAYS